jgi:hypothetical protein
VTGLRTRSLSPALRGALAIAMVAAAPCSFPSAAGAQDAPASSETAARETASVERGVAPAGFALVVQPEGGEPRVLCEPECELDVPVGPTRFGWRRGGRAVEWQRELLLDVDVRLDVRHEDRALLRGAGHALLVATGVLLMAVAVVGIATEPTPPDHGWFAERHGLVFAAIAGGIVLGIGGPGIGLAVAFERDAPVLEVVPEE